MEILTQERLKELLIYEHNTGLFKWIICKQGITSGTVAGYLNVNNYINIGIDYNTYLAHRLVWLYVYGKFPDNMIDHINGIKNDNRLCNLREATRSQNFMNRKEFKNNQSGYKGISFHKKANKWRAQICINNVNKHLGLFVNKEDAIEAYKKESSLLHGEFAYKRDIV